MASYIKILIRRDTTANWESSNPVLSLGEIAADLEKHGLKVGDGVTSWNNLAWCTPEMVDNLVAGGADKVLTAEQGKVLKIMVDNKADNSTVTNLSNTVTNMNATLTQEINKLKETVQEILEKASIFGMGYTVENINAYSKPTRIKFDDGVTADLMWTGSRLDMITASTGETMTINYTNGRVSGRTITKAS